MPPSFLRTDIVKFDIKICTLLHNICNFLNLLHIFKYLRKYKLTKLFNNSKPRAGFKFDIFLLKRNFISPSAYLSLCPPSLQG